MMKGSRKTLLEEQHGDTTTHSEDTQQEEATTILSTVTGDEPFLAGISPTYWAHVPLTIGALLHDLHVVNGINCWRSTPTNTRTTQQEHAQRADCFVPLSKCLLVGTIIGCSAIRSDGSKTFILDDGTGMIDCVAWTTNDHYNPDDIYSLPNLLPSNNSNKTLPTVRLGASVRVFGKIQCLHIIHNHNGDERSTTGKRRTISSAIREIQASLVEPLGSDDDRACRSNSSSTSTHNANAELQHWIQACRFQTNVMTNPESCNAIECLRELGPTLQTQILTERRNLPKIDNDTLGSWRVFGVNCSCQTEYDMDQLLYCHCKAKLDPCDPHFVFRDRLLSILEDMQANVVQKQPLVFPYRLIKQNEALKTLAMEMMMTASGAPHATKNPAVFLNRMFVNTFRALRKDGILYLADQDKDTYQLITRDRVLEPFVRDKVMAPNDNDNPRKGFIDFRGNPVLANVDRERLFYIRRCLTATQDDS